MTNEEAARILDPKTTLEVYAETEYYSGFDGAKRWKEAVDEACIMGANALREQSGTDTNVGGKWISVKDRLPDKTNTYLAYCGEYDGINLLNYAVLGIVGDKIKGKWKSKYRTVTHWQPLPEPPTE